MEGCHIADSASVARLRQSIEADIALADALGLSLVAIWLEHARQELGPYRDRETHNAAN